MVRGGLVALTVAAAVAGAACSGGEDSEIEADVAARFAAFPSEAQPRGIAPWPDGRFAGDCGAEPGGIHLCFYEDPRGRQGFVCFAADEDGLRVLSAAGAHDPGRRFDHDGRALPPDERCAD